MSLGEWTHTDRFALRLLVGRTRSRGRRPQSTILEWTTVLLTSRTRRVGGVAIKLGKGLISTMISAFWSLSAWRPAHTIFNMHHILEHWLFAMKWWLFLFPRRPGPRGCWFHVTPVHRGKKEQQYYSCSKEASCIFLMLRMGQVRWREKIGLPRYRPRE